MQRKSLSLVASLCLSLALMAGCGQKSPESKPPAQPAQPANPSSQAAPEKKQELPMPGKIRIGYQVIANTETIVKNQGWLEKEFGVPVEWKQFDSGRDVNTAMASGAIDIGLVGSAPAAAGIAQNLPYEVIWIYDAIGDAESLVVRKASNISKAADLAGKKIAVPFGSTAHYSLLKYLQSEGVDAARVTILDMQPQDMLAAWQRGDIDGGWVWHPTLKKMIDTNGKVLVTGVEMIRRGYFTGDLGVVNKEFARKYPHVVARYLKLQHDAAVLYKTRPDDGIAAIAREFQLKADEAKAISAEVIWLDGNEQLSDRYLGQPGKTGDLARVLKDTADFLVTQKTIKAAPDLSVFQQNVNPRYLAEGMKK